MYVQLYLLHNLHSHIQPFLNNPPYYKQQIKNYIKLFESTDKNNYLY